MPEVDVLQDPLGFFESARRTIETGPDQNRIGDERFLGIVTPGRMILFQSAASLSEDDIKQVRDVLPFEPPLQLTVIAYTRLDSLMTLADRNKCIPFLGWLMAFAAIGHNVLVFEGHPSAFEAGCADTDILLIDSGMLPFLQADWMQAARRVMRPGSRVFIHNRETYTLFPVAPSARPQGWQYSEHDGESSYANCLLTTLAKGPGQSVEIVAGRALPDLAPLASDPDELDWIEGLPFRYDAMDADKVIDILLKTAVKRRWIVPQSTWRLRTRVVTPNREWIQEFKFKLKRGEPSRTLIVSKL
jgi:hypothetical protein